MIYCFSLLFLSVLQLYPYFKQLVSFFPPLQIEVVNTFKSGTSFQGALRRQSSVTSQTQDVTNISSPSHVSLSNALSSPTSTSAAAAGRECVFLMHQTYRDANLCSSHLRLNYFALSHFVLLCLLVYYPATQNWITLCTVDALHHLLQVTLGIVRAGICRHFLSSYGDFIWGFCVMFSWCHCIYCSSAYKICILNSFVKIL